MQEVGLSNLGCLCFQEEVCLYSACSKTNGDGQVCTPLKVNLSFKNVTECCILALSLLVGVG